MEKKHKYAAVDTSGDFLTDLSQHWPVGTYIVYNDGGQRAEAIVQAVEVDTITGHVSHFCSKVNKAPQVTPRPRRNNGRK